MRPFKGLRTKGLRPMPHPGLCRCARRVLPRLAPCRGGRPCGLNPSPSAQSRRNKPRTAGNWQPLRQVTFPTHPVCTFTYPQCASSGFCSGCRSVYSRFRASRRLIEKSPSEGTRARPPTLRYRPDRVSPNKAARLGLAAKAGRRIVDAMAKPRVTFKMQRIAEDDWQILAEYPGVEPRYIKGLKSKAEVDEWLQGTRRIDWLRSQGYAK